MIQKKICMVGLFATGKTSLVRQFVYSKFSESYHSTIGVKIDRKDVTVDGQEVKLLLWDLAGKDGFEDIQTSYLRGTAGILYVADGTRRETVEELTALRQRAESAVGSVPSLVALNKHDLTNAWALTDADIAALTGDGWRSFLTSAKTGNGVEDAFHQLAREALAS